MSTKRGVKPVGGGSGGPTGRTTSPPAPRQREQMKAQPACASGTASVSSVGHLEASQIRSLVDPGRSLQHQSYLTQTEVPKNVDLRMHQMITNAATKEQYEAGADDPPPSISCIAFDKTGDHMAYGDRAGRCYIFTRNGGGGGDDYQNASAGYTLLDVVEAYSPQLDTLNSTQIEAKVNVIKFVDMGNGSLFFLTANDKSVKMWKIWDRTRSTQDTEYEPINALLEDWKSLQFPKVSAGEKRTWHKELKQFASDHEYHINSVSVSSNKEHFISSDDLTVQMWHVGHPEQSLRVLDRRPDNMEDLSETITSCTFHSFHPQELYVANSKGIVSCYDLRVNVSCNDAANTLTAPPASGPNVYLQSILAGISDIKSSPCGKYIVARDYLSVKVWDVRKGNACVKVWPGRVK